MGKPFQLRRGMVFPFAPMSIKRPDRWTGSPGDYCPVKRCHRRRFVTLPDRTRHGDEISPGADQSGGIFRCDPANSNAGYFKQALPPGQYLRLGVMLHRFGRRWKERSKGDIVRPCLACFHRQMPAGVAGHADLRFPAKLLAGIAQIAIRLPQMNPIRANALGQ